MACVAVNSLVRTIELEFLQPQPRSIVQEKELISCNKELIQSLHEKLRCLIELFDETRMDGVKAIKDLETRLRDIAFKVEDEIELQVGDLYEEEELEIERQRVIDSEDTQGDIEAEEEIGIADEVKPQGNTHAKKTWHSRLCHILKQAIEDIDSIKEELVKVKMEYKHAIALQGRKTTLDVLPKHDEVIVIGASSQRVSHSEDKMIGKDKEFEIIKKMLIEHGSKQQKVVSIIGMGGIGKTTLARRVYEDPLIASHFDKKAWVVASQLHNKRQMLVGLLNSMGMDKGDATSSTDDELALQLYQGLKQQRYLVVVDDIWNGEAWDAVKACFPDDGNDSRVLVTTRHTEVTKLIGSYNELSLQMQLLDESEGWNLFHEKACKSRGDEFETIGRPIVEKCKGLPLAIVVVAGLFSKLNTLDEWKNIAEALKSSATIPIDEECSRILTLSYNHLPHNLKACFLYLGVFPEDKEIYSSKLARLWSAEGLVKASENESYHAVAKRYVQELMDRNLILLSQRCKCGRNVKSFRMHDLLLAFCVSKAQNENLLHVACENDSDFPQKGFRWLSIQSLEHFDVPTLYNFSKSCRSIFDFLGWTTQNLEKFNVLRVISWPDDIYSRSENLDSVHLRYVSGVQISEKTLKLRRAWNLQTLHIMEDDVSKYLEFPQLQHLDSPFMHTCKHPSKFVHQNLRSISRVPPNFCTKELFTNFPDLKKVVIAGDPGDCNDCIENLAYLQKLEKLCIDAEGGLEMIQINNNIVLLKNLRKLSFLGMTFEWKEINVLSKLPMLEVLKLLLENDGKEWELSEEEEFCQLIFLKIENFLLKHWKANANNFPKLERLRLSHCESLKEIPIEFAEISTLKSIELITCSRSAATSAKQIKEVQRDYGNENMVVIEKNTLQYDFDAFESDEEEYDELEEDSSY